MHTLCCLRRIRWQKHVRKHDSSPFKLIGWHSWAACSRHHIKPANLKAATIFSRCCITHQWVCIKSSAFRETHVYTALWLDHTCLSPARLYWIHLEGLLWKLVAMGDVTPLHAHLGEGKRELNHRGEEWKQRAADFIWIAEWIDKLGLKKFWQPSVSGRAAVMEAVSLPAYFGSPSPSHWWILFSNNRWETNIFIAFAALCMFTDIPASTVRAATMEFGQI